MYLHDTPNIYNQIIVFILEFSIVHWEMLK